MEHKKAKTTHKRRRTVTSHAPTHRRRRRIGAIAVHRKKAATKDTSLMDVLKVAAGAIGGVYIDKFIPESWEPKLKAGAKIAAGFFLPKLSKNVETKKTLKFVGFGLASEGAVELATAFGIAGFGKVGDLKDDDLLVVSLDGVDDKDEFDKKRPIGEFVDYDDVLNDDILNDGNIPTVSDDINVIQDDILNDFE